VTVTFICPSADPAADSLPTVKLALITEGLLTVVESFDIHPNVSVIETEYVPGIRLLIVADVCPLDHKYETPAAFDVAVAVPLESPAQRTFVDEVEADKL
jgi:hypothetical protein